MLVILTIALVIMNLIKYGTSAVHEGFETEDDYTEKEKMTEMSDKSTITSKMAADDLKKGYNELVQIKEDIVDGLLKATKGLTDAESKVTQLQKSLKTANQEFQ
jgi:hypothetical protein